MEIIITTTGLNLPYKMKAIQKVSVISQTVENAVVGNVGHGCNKTSTTATRYTLS